MRLENTMAARGDICLISIWKVSVRFGIRSLNGIALCTDWVGPVSAFTSATSRLPMHLPVTATATPADRRPDRIGPDTIWNLQEALYPIRRIKVP